jgi:trehalose-6-phosphate synthase
MVSRYLQQILPDVKIGLLIYANFPHSEYLTPVYGTKQHLNSVNDCILISFNRKQIYLKIDFTSRSHWISGSLITETCIQFSIY